MHGMACAMIVSLLVVFCCSLTLTMSQIPAAYPQLSLPGCPSTCGNLENIPYPFGIGETCSREGFQVTCNHTFTPSRAFLDNISTVEVESISLIQGQATAKYLLAYDCYNVNHTRAQYFEPYAGAGSSTPYTFSSQRNKFTVIGCDTYAYIKAFDPSEYTGGCISRCRRLGSVVNGSCSGIGCCQTPIPKGLKYYTIEVRSFQNHTGVMDFNPCSYAFLVDQDNFTFHTEDITPSSPYSSARKSPNSMGMPVAIDWVAGNESCDVARRDPGRFACRSDNSYCYNSTSSATGYLCNCSPGYEGNPYLDGGCQDIDECNSPEKYPCKGVCVNIAGSFTCNCKKGWYGNATYDCRKENVPLTVILATVLPALFVTVLTICLYGLFEKRKRGKLAEKLYRQNGGPVLEVHLSTHRDIQNRFKIFTKEELERATNNFDDKLIIGHGGQGKVYKGTLDDDTTVAIKKSVENIDMDLGFINEIIILSQIYHPNVVKLLGCCLEVDIPYLVYEFVPNKALIEHIQGPGLAWEKRLSIAAGAAKALAYLHTIGIYHQDVKSGNVLLTMNHTAKIADFGLSRLVPTDAKALSTIVQGTLGYLDPEFIVSHKLTGKSDVFSFGVVLAELLTGKLPISPGASDRERSLAQHFKLCMEENSVFEILDRQIVGAATSAARAEIMEVAELADQCLNMKGKDRPDMGAVFQKLDELWRSGYHQPDEDENAEATQSLLPPQTQQPLYDEAEESRMLFSVIKCDHIAAFDMETGR